LGQQIRIVKFAMTHIASTQSQCRTGRNHAPNFTQATHLASFKPPSSRATSTGPHASGRPARGTNIAVPQGVAVSPFFLGPLPTSSSTHRQCSGPTRTGSQRTHDCTASHALLQPKYSLRVFTPRMPAGTARLRRSVPMTSDLYKTAEPARNKRPEISRIPALPNLPSSSSSHSGPC